MFTSGEKLVEIRIVVAQIFRFLPSRPKKCSCCPHGVTGPILIIIAHDVTKATMLPLNILKS